MTDSPLTDTAARRQFLYVLALFVVISAAIVTVMLKTAKPWRYGGDTIFGQTFLVGPTAESLVNQHQMLVCTTAMGTPGNPICFRSARMPIASGTLAAGVLLLGDRPQAITYLKNILYMLPLWAAVGLVLWEIRRTPTVLWLTAACLLLPLLLPNYIGIIVNVDAEESYLFGLLALAVALTLHPRNSVRWIVALALTLNLVFLCKSSMLPAFLVLAAGAFVGLASTRLRLLLVLLVSLAPLGWAMRQHHVSGRFSVGTSLDGLNFHKGNNIHFLERYPKDNTLLDSFDVELNRGLHFDSEWQYNDYHLEAGKRFALGNPAYTLRSTGRKIWVMLFSLNRMASHPYGLAATVVLTATILVFRLLLWGSLLVAFYSAWTDRLLGRLQGFTYVGFVLAYYAPYIAGFGYMRHIIMMAYPAVLALCIAWIRSRTPLTTSPAE